VSLEEFVLYLVFLKIIKLQHFMKKIENIVYTESNWKSYFDLVKLLGFVVLIAHWIV
jgi:hypothetical protein